MYGYMLHYTEKWAHSQLAAHTKVELQPCCHTLSVSNSSNWGSKREWCNCFYGPTPTIYWGLPPSHYSLLVHTCTALVNEIIIVLSNLVLVFPLILILVQNMLMNVSKIQFYRVGGSACRKWVVWSLCAFRCCPGCAVLVVDFRWSVKNILENGRKQDGAVVGVFWPLPALLNTHSRLTPLHGYIPFTSSMVVVCASPPILLVLHLKVLQLGWQARTSIEFMKWKGANICRQNVVRRRVNRKLPWTSHLHESKSSGT